MAKHVDGEGKVKLTLHHIYLTNPQTFKCIFTSPSSAIDEKDADEPAPAKRRRTTKPNTRKNVASKIGLTSVTGRSIAYIAVQVRDAIITYPDFLC